MMIQLIRFYLRSTGLILPALLIGSIVINGLALVLTWLIGKPAVFPSLAVTTVILCLCLFVVGIRLNLRDLKISSFTIAGMLPVSQGKLLGAKLLTGCGIIIVGILMQMILAIGLISVSGHPKSFGLFDDSIVVFQEEQNGTGEKSVKIVETGKDGQVRQEINVRKSNADGEALSITAVKNKDQSSGSISVGVEGSVGNIRTDSVGVHGDSGELMVGMTVHAQEMKMAALFGFLAIPMLFGMVICFGVYPFVWARHFTQKAFLAKILAVVFIGMMFTIQGIVTESTGYLLGVSTGPHSGADWISFSWNFALCIGSYLFTSWFRERKMDLQ